MNKYTLAATAIASLFVGTASAASFDLNGSVTEVCTVGSTTNALSSLSTGSVGAISGLSITCNDFDGATIVLTSAEGGLQGIDSEDLVIPYVATLNMGGLADLVLDLSSNGAYGVNDTSVSADYTGAELVGGVTATLDVVVGAGSAWAGAYHDQLTVSITAL